jgi:hypothetical protein
MVATFGDPHIVTLPQHLVASELPINTIMHTLLSYPVFNFFYKRRLIESIKDNVFISSNFILNIPNCIDWIVFYKFFFGTSFL